MTHPNHHPDIRWVMAITAIITAGVVGGLLYIDARASNPARVLAQETSPGRKAAATIDELQRRIAGLQTVVTNLQLELKDQAVAVTPSTVVNTAPQKFTSRHQFSFVHPGNWQVMDAHAETYPDLAMAQAAGGNYISFVATGTKPEDSAQITFWVFNQGLPKTINQWIAASAPKGAKIEDFLMAGQPAKRVRAIGADKTPTLSYYQLVGNRGVLVRILPAHPANLTDIEAALMSFTF